MVRRVTLGKMTIHAPLSAPKLFSTSNCNSFALNNKMNYRRFSMQIFCSNAVVSSIPNSQRSDLSAIHYDSLRILEWDKLCDFVASFAGTSSGREAIKAQLWSLDNNYEDSLALLKETNAAIEMHKHGACRLDFTGLDLSLLKSAIRHVLRGLAVSANEAIAVASLLEFADVLKLNLESAIKEDAEWHNRFMPLSKMIMELVISRSLARTIRLIIDDDGSVKDSASPVLRRSRDQVRMLEKKLHQLMDSLIRNDAEEESFLEVSNINGRWCIKSSTNELTNFRGLLLSSDSGMGSVIEPLTAVPINDELQRARASVAKAEADLLLNLTEKMQKDLDDIEKVSDTVIRLDVINARATYSLAFGGASPDLYLPQEMDGPFASEASLPSKREEWLLYMPKAYHPLLLKKHRQNLQKMRKNGTNVTNVSEVDSVHPVPVDFFIAQKTKVLVITGPNTGGKTICLKTIGLAAMMAKSGLHVLSSESVQIPWVDHILVDIGDEQSLSQSLSTFSGHLKQISDIRSQSTNQSLVLLDEVGAGTNPLEGAALGMSLLESFADNGALLTIATTHHGELKSLKYSNGAFENACMEFDEVNLKPTYKILWGVPGRSNAINISEKLGLPDKVISNARQLYGAASAEINEVIIDMEKFKQDAQASLYQGQHHLMLSRHLHGKLLLARKKIMEHGFGQRYRKMQEIYELAATARSIMHKKARQLRAHSPKLYQSSTANKRKIMGGNQSTEEDNSGINTESISLSSSQAKAESTAKANKQPVTVRRTGLPKVGDMVPVSSLGRKATVLEVDPSKELIVVQAGNMKLKLKLTDINVV
ncbi:Endonuclease MutS2 [Euphorbia peplus]|nr:Endonuclease MutS2 [Euphorbia peplus]